MGEAFLLPGNGGSGRSGPADSSSVRERLNRAKAAYTTRRADTREMAALLTGHLQPAAGDLVLARVDKLGQHRHLELQSGRRALLYPGDDVLLCYGNRYAPDQFEAVVPDDLGPCHLAAGGGIAATVLSSYQTQKPPTKITPIGIIGDHLGNRLNLSRWAVPFRKDTPRPYTIAVVGTAMNAGKTTLAASLTRGFVKAGLRVGTAKITGTGSGGDVWAMIDAGAAVSLDFTDAGFASTYKLSIAEVERVFLTLTATLASFSTDVLILEVADGLLQLETAQLLSSPVFAEGVDGLIFAAMDAMGAVAGVSWLQARGLKVLGVGGVLTASPLARLEADRASGHQVLLNDLLASGACYTDIFPLLRGGCTDSASGQQGPVHLIERFRPQPAAETLQTV